MFAVMNSTCSTARDPRRLFFHILTTDAESYRLLKASIEEHLPLIKFELKIFDATLMKDTKPIVWKNYRSSSLSKPIVYARFFFHEIFPTLARIIYLDNDILVKKDITPLWELNMGQYPIAAARLCRESALFKNQFDFSSGKLAAFDPEECSLNNGVLVYNMPQWAGKDYASQLRRWTALNSEFKLWGLGSQPPFNLVFYRNYHILSDIWNLMDLSGLVNTHTHRPITRPLALVAKAHILHWNGVYKPWNGDGPYGEIWRKYVQVPKSHRGYNRSRQYGQDDFLVTGSSLDPELYQFTAVIVSRMRSDTLVLITDRLRKLDNCKQILIVWIHPGKSCPEFTQRDHRVQCILPAGKHPHDRFLVWERVSTAAVLHHDDNSLLSLKDIELGFRTWLLNPDVLVGFQPRRIQCSRDDKLKKAFCSYSFQIPDAAYDLLDGSHFFVHREYMRLYSDRSEIVKLNQKASCEDIAMNFLVGALSKLPVIWVNPTSLILLRSSFESPETSPKNSTGSLLDPRKDILEWGKTRSQCLVQMLNAFSGNPMREQTHFVYDYDPVENSIWFRSVALANKSPQLKPLSICFDYSGITKCKAN
eukprot:Sdes_comp20779_c0_seq2m16845